MTSLPVRLDADHTDSTHVEPSPTDVRRVVIGVEGMTCTACSARVERTLNKIDGLTASVNFATGRASVDIAGAGATAVDDERIAAVIRKCGYTPAPFNADDPTRGSDAEERRARQLFRRFVVALLLFVPLADFAIIAALVPAARFTGWQWLLVALCLPVVTWCAWPFHRAAGRNALRGAGTMDTLVSAGILISTGWSLVSIFSVDPSLPPPDGLWAAMTHSGSIYLETAAGITVLVLGGRYLEASARARAGSAVRELSLLTARDATVQLPGGGTMQLPASELRVGHRVICSPGDRLGVDGIVREGSTSLDTSALTGEAVPWDVGPDAPVEAGHLVLTGRVVVEATAVGPDTRLGGMIGLIERAQADKSLIQHRIDRISMVFVPTVLLVALAAAVGWALAGAPIDRVITVGLGVLVIACPCALGLATPVALLTAAGRGARHGIFVKSQQALDLADEIDVVVWDKTGTLTTGELDVSELLDNTGQQVEAPSWLAVAAAAEAGSRHPFGIALVRYAREHGCTAEAAELTEAAGVGVTALVDGVTVTVGRPHRGGPQPVTALLVALAALADTGRSTAVVAVDGTIVGAVATTDGPRPSASSALERLRMKGIRTVVLSGDNAGAVRRLADQIGADEYLADLLPADKVEYIRRQQQQGRRVAMVGDGINDGPALATADLGIAVGRGTDVAIGAADIVLVRDDLDGVAEIVDLATATRRTIRGNLVWAFGYNVAAIPLAVAGLANPLIASAAMAASSLFVVFNSMRLDKR